MTIRNQLLRRVGALPARHRLRARAATLARAVATALGAALLAAGCQVGPEYVRPDIDTPEVFTAGLDRGLVAGAADLDRWWTRLEDPVLDSLVARALERNLDLRESLARIREARAFRGIAETDRLPTFDARGAVTREQVSNAGALGDLPGSRRTDSYSAGIDASWELDLWGRIARSVEAADAEVDVSVEDARGALVSVLAETALSYVDLRSAQDRLRIARSNVDLRTQTLDLTQNLFDADLVSRLDVLQARADLESTRSTVPTLETAVRAAKNRLAVLLGLAPGALEQELADAAPVPVPPTVIAVGVPAGVLRRRPDIRRAERALAAQSARIGVAEADLYPRLALFGDVGVQATHGSELTGSDAVTYGVGPSIRWNLFDRGRIRRGIEIEDARFDQALVGYERSLLLALEEVENALTRFVSDQQQRDALVLAVDASSQAVGIARDQYRQGLTGFQSVLDSQRRLFALEEARSLTDASITSSLIQLYRALGGGWEQPDVPVPEAATSAAPSPDASAPDAP